MYLSSDLLDDVFARVLCEGPRRIRIQALQFQVNAQLQPSDSFLNI